MSQSTDIAAHHNKTEHLPASVRAAIELLRSWRDVNAEDAKEQCETLEFLVKVLDEDRPSSRKLFP